VRAIRQKGLALVIVLWVISLLTIMAASFALTMRRETVVIRAIKENAVALSAAESGVFIAQQMEMQKDDSKRWKVDGRVYSVQHNNAEIRIQLLSEKGKIDVNKADEVLLTSLIASTQVTMEKKQMLVSAIMDWRDSDDLVRMNGAEKLQYEDEGLAYHPANRDFESIDELQMVLGFNSTIFQKIKPLITVYSKQAKVDESVAAKEVLQVIGVIEPVEMEEEVSSTQQKNSNDVFFNENNTDKEAGRNTPVYTINSQARVFSDVLGAVQVTIKKLSNKKGRASFKVLDWQQNYQNFSLFSDEVDQQLAAIKDEPEYEY